MPTSEELNKIASEFAPSHPTGEIFEKGFERGLKRFEASFPALKGVGISALEKVTGQEIGDEIAALQRAQKTSEEAPEPLFPLEGVLKNPTADNIWGFVVETVGEQAINIASTLAGGGIGGIAAGLTIPKFMGTLAGQGLLKESTALAIAKAAQTAGSTAGSFATYAGLETADTAEETFTRRGEIRPFEAIGIGATKGIIGTATYLPFLSALGINNKIGQKIYDSFTRQLAGKGLLARSATGGLIAGAANSTEEMLEESVDLAYQSAINENFEFLGEEGKMRLLEAGAKAFVLGVPLGAGAGAIQRSPSPSKRSLPAESLALLDAIAVKESTSYGDLYGGGKFNDFSSHPHEKKEILTGPNAGQFSTAAGKYQFLGKTWDQISAKYGLSDFSPENQDLGAWYLAAEVYQSKTGRDLLEDLQKGDQEIIEGVSRVLSGTWTSLPGGIEQTTTPENFARKYQDFLLYQQQVKGVPFSPAQQKILGFDEEGLKRAGLYVDGELRLPFTKGRPVFSRSEIPLGDEIDDQFSEKIEDIGVSVNLPAIVQSLGSSFYKDLSQTTLKEILQNSFDALKAGQFKGEITQGQIDVDLSNEGRTIIVQDNGIGMNEKGIRDALFRIGGSEKGDIPFALRSGGFGFAKLAYQTVAEEYKVTTVRNGQKITISTTGEEILKAVNDPENYRLKNIIKSPTRDPNGTKIEVTLPEKVYDPIQGKDVKIGRLFYPDIGKQTFLPFTLNVTENGIKTPTEPRPTGKLFRTIQFPNFSADIYIAKGQGSMDVYSSGVYQFSEYLPKNLSDPYGPIISHNIVLDIKSKVPAKDPTYPFSPNRQNIKDLYKEAFKTIRHGIINISNNSAIIKGADRLGQLKQIVNDKIVENLLESESPKGMDFGTSFRNISLSEFQQEAFETLEKDQFTTRKDQYNFTGVDDNVKSSDGKTITQNMIEKFGEENYIKYIEDLTNIFRQMLYLLDPGYGEKVIVGVSFDKSYLGIRSHVPFDGIFINPAGLALEYETSFERAIGTQITMVHEIAHLTSVAPDGSSRFEDELQNHIHRLMLTRDWATLTDKLENFYSVNPVKTDELRTLYENGETIGDALQGESQSIRVENQSEDIRTSLGEREALQDRQPVAGEHVLAGKVAGKNSIADFSKQDWTSRLNKEGITIQEGFQNEDFQEDILRGTRRSRVSDLAFQRMLREEGIPQENFTKDFFIFGESSEELNSLLRDLQKKFLPKSQIIFAYNPKFKGDFLKEANDKAGAHLFTPSGKHLITISDRGSLTSMADSLWHEFSHAIVGEEIIKLSERDFNNLVNAYEKWRGESQEKLGSTEFGRFHAITRSHTDTISKSFGKTSLNEKIAREWYYTFDEWIADQGMLYFRKNFLNEHIQETFDPNSGFFQKLGKMFYDLYKEIRTKLGLEITQINPDQMVEKFFDNLRQEIDSPLTFKKDSISKSINSSPSLPLKLAFDLSEKTSLDLDRFSWWVKKAWGILQIIKENRHIQGIPEYGEGLREFNQTVMSWITRSDQHLQEWWALGKHAESLGNFFDDLNNMVYLDPMDKLVGEKPRHPTIEEFQTLVKKHQLTPEALEVYTRIRNDFRDFAVMFTQAEIDRINRTVTDPELKSVQIALKRKILRNWLGRPYFPLARFGDYKVAVWQENNLLHSEQFEKESQLNKRMKELEKTFPKTRIVGTKLNSQLASIQNMPVEILESLKNELELDVDQAAMLDAFIHERENPRKFAKKFEHRKFIPGYSKDHMRVYASYFFSGAKFLAKRLHEHKMEDALNLLRNTIQESISDQGITSLVKRKEILHHLIEHKDYLMTPQNEWAGIRSFTFLWYLGFAVKSMFVNMTQLPVFTYSFLSDIFGDIKAVNKLSNGIHSGIRLAYGKTPPKNLSESFLKTYQRLVESQLLDESQSAELGAISEGSFLQRTLGSGTSKKLREFAFWGSFGFHQVERMSRRIAAISAWELAMENPNTPYVLDLARLFPEEAKTLSGKNWTPQEINAFFFARDTIETTLFEYSRFNRPSAMWGKKGVIFIFQNFIQNALWMMKNAPGGKRVLLMTFALAGLMGLPGSEDFNDMITAFSKKILGKDFNPKEELRELAASIDEDAPDILLHGLGSNSFGLPLLAEMINLGGIPSFDISQSFSFGDLVPLTEVLAQTGDFSGKFLRGSTDVGGAAVSIPLAFLQALSDDNPDNFKRWERTMPTALKNMSKALRFANEHKETYSRSRKTLATFDPTKFEDNMEIAGQFFGFTPQRIRKGWDELRAKKENEEFWNYKKAALYAEFFAAYKAQDFKWQDQLIQRMTEFNKESPTKISGAGIRKSIKMRMKAENDLQ